MLKDLQGRDSVEVIRREAVSSKGIGDDLCAEVRPGVNGVTGQRLEAIDLPATRLGCAQEKSAAAAEVEQAARLTRETFENIERSLAVAVEGRALGFFVLQQRPF